MSKLYNRVYETLVKDEFDLVGFIAYSYYKQEKRKQIIDIITKEDRNPNQKEYNLIESLLTQHIDLYRKKAEEILNGTIEHIMVTEKSILYEKYFKSYEYKLLEDKLNTIQDNTNNDNLKSKLDTAIINTKRKYVPFEILMGILGNFFWAVVLILFWVILYFSSSDVRNFKEKVIEILQEQKDTTIKK